MYKKTYKQIERLSKQYISVFFPQWYNYVKGIKVVYKTTEEIPDITAHYYFGDKTIHVYYIKNEVDLFRTFLHEYAHAIDYIINKHEKTHTHKWVAIMNKMLKPLKAIHKEKISRFF